MSSAPAMVTASFRVAVPMFLGGYAASGNAGRAVSPHAPLRIPSVKGQLRFWWRALQWSRFRAEASSDTDALPRLHREEQLIFGSAASEADPDAGQSRVQISAVDLEHKLTSFQPKGLEYLLGQGLSDKTGLLRTPDTVSNFGLRLLFRRDLSPQRRESVLEALWVFGLLGGLGARNRRGFGSVSLTQWSGRDATLAERFEVPSDLTSYARALGALARRCGVEHLPPFSAFSSHTRIDVSAKHLQKGTPIVALLIKANAALSTFRRSGTGADQKRVPDAFNASNSDVALMLEYLAGKTPHRVAARSVFGLPHNYFFRAAGKVETSLLSSRRQAPRSTHQENEGTPGRRASPLLMHVHALPNGNAALVHVLLKSRFFPDAAKLLVKPSGHDAVEFPVNDDHIDWQLIHSYLDHAFEKPTTICGKQ